MSEFLGPQDIYDKLVENSSDNWILGLVAFAVIEEERIEWMKHKKNNTSTYPTPEEIENWYKEQPETILLRAKDTAEARLKDYSSEAITVFEETYCNDIRNSILISEIQNTKKFLPQFGINILGGLISSLIFSAIILLLWFTLVNDLSATKIVENATQKNKQETKINKEISNVEKGSN